MHTHRHINSKGDRKAEWVGGIGYKMLQRNPNVPVITKYVKEPGTPDEEKGEKNFNYRQCFSPF